MGLKKKLAKTGLAQFVAQNTPLLHGVGKKLVPAKTSEEALEVARQLADEGFHVCLHHLGKASDELEDIQNNVAVVNETMEIMAEENLEVCISLTPSELGYLKSIKSGDGHCKRIAKSFLARQKVQGVQDRQGFGEGSVEGRRSQLMIHAAERVSMQQILALYGVFKRSNVGSCVTIPSGLWRSEDDIKSIISQGGSVRLSLLPAQVADTRSIGDFEDAQDNYIKLARLLLCEDAMIQQVVPIFALEDEDMANQVKAMADFEGWSNAAYEFEIPYGVNTSLCNKLLEEGHTVRILVPYGKEWWPYFIKRSEI